MDPIIIPTDAVVLVTNATQPIPLQVVKQLLERGCRVRAATACDEDGSWMAELFPMHTYSGRFEHIKLTHDNQTDSSLYEDAVKGVYAVVHSPTVAYLNQPPKEVWAKTAESVLSMLAAAKGEKSVQAFVYTSSIVAVTSLSTPSEAPVLVTEDSWNAKDVVLALTGKHNDHVVHDSALVYAEQSLWHWQDKQCPKFKINVISPSNLIGQNFAPHRTSDWQNWLLELYRNGRATEVITNAGPTQARKFRRSFHIGVLMVADVARQIGMLTSRTWLCCTLRPSSTPRSPETVSMPGDASAIGTTPSR